MAVDQAAEVAAAVQRVAAVDAPLMVVEADPRQTTAEALGVAQDDLTGFDSSEPSILGSSIFPISPASSWRERSSCHVECGYCRTYGDKHPAGFVPSSTSWT